MAAITHRIVGGWSLLSWTMRFDDGRPARQPYGDSPNGSLLYSADGRMLAAIARADRKHLSGQVPQRAPESEKTAAFDSFFSYGGSFDIDGDEVVHRVDIALNPNFVGSVQRRKMHFEDNQLTLSAKEGERHHELIWQRIASAAGN
ncbi:MAG TPA: hypothetical protein DIW43_02310 [Spongiibacteraceae bacterium]|nr:hypothetical protein [Spongiibacteraceae bacterium]HCS26256.1 hypothetical protein [Spongiibacteraceae bacterium]